MLVDRKILCVTFACRISGKKAKHYEQIQQQIEEEIEDEIALADEEYQRAKAAHANLVKKRKLQSIRRVNLSEKFHGEIH